VQAYLDAMPEWKHHVGVRLDELVIGAVPGVRKAMRWNTPFYGLEGNGWFLGFHCFKRYVKVSFLNGASLDPLGSRRGARPLSRGCRRSSRAPPSIQASPWPKHDRGFGGEHEKRGPA